jgi:hypothetical protein
MSDRIARNGVEQHGRRLVRVVEHLGDPSDALLRVDSFDHPKATDRVCRREPRPHVERWYGDRAIGRSAALSVRDTPGVRTGI